MKLLKSLNIVSFGLLLASPAAALSDAEFDKMAQEAFGAAITEYDIPGMAIGVTIDGERHVYTYGMASRSGGVEVTPDTLFELGSISKLFNVTLAALAQGRGLLDLSAPVSDYLTDLKGSAFDTISVMDLASHTSDGLPLQVPGGVADEAALMRWLQDWRPLGSVTPRRSYSNISMGLLGKIGAEAMGTGYKQATEGALFPMLGLESTWIEVPDAAMARYAYGYSRKDNSEIRVNPGVFDDEAYGVKSTVGDMLQFLEVNLGHGTIAPEMRAAIDLTHQGLTRTEYYTQAMVWEGYSWPVETETVVLGNSAPMALESQPVTPFNPPARFPPNCYINKTGATFGFGAYVALLPGQEMGIVALANRNYPNEARVRATLRLIELINAAK